MRVFSTLFIGLVLSCCYSQKRTITFINQSEDKIDSISIEVFSADLYSITHSNIEKSDKVITSIPHTVPKSNNHDITISISIYIKNHDLIYRYYYNDLAGYLSNDYTIVLTKEKKVQWIMQH
jgi:hypothetical protein